MYKAIHTLTGEEIVILHPRWRHQLDALRQMDHADLLVCQGCRQPLRVKAGEVKRPHFAHKHLKACSYGTETPEILAARGVLYDWLLDQFHEGVTLEQQLEGSGLPRPVDAWVETGRGIFAYWIIETGIKLAPRDAIRAAFARSGTALQESGRTFTVHYIFLQAMLNEEKKAFHSLLLTPTERVFLQTTPYDESLGSPGETGQTIHYLDAESETLTTYRGLRLFHRPNWYKGFKKTSPLSEVRAGQVDGEPVHPGERDRLGAFRQRQQRQQDRRQRYLDRLEHYLNHIEDPEAEEPDGEDQAPSRPQAPPAPAHTFLQPGPAKRVNRNAQAEPQPELPCAICGQITADYWSTFYDESGRKLCRCRECLEKGSEA